MQTALLPKPAIGTVDVVHSTGHDSVCTVSTVPEFALRLRRELRMLAWVFLLFIASQARAIDSPNTTHSIHTTQESTEPQSYSCDGHGPAVWSVSPIMHEPTSFDVLHYDVQLNMSAAPKLSTEGSRCTITFRWIQTPDSFQLHLRSLRIDSVYYLQRNGSTIAVNYVKNGSDTSALMYYAVPAAAVHKRFDTVSLVVVYSGTMTSEAPINGFSWGGVSRDQTDAVYSLGVGFSNPYVSCTQHWMPCFDLPQDKATLHARILCPKQMMALSNGSFVGSTAVSDTTLREYEWDMKEPCATYLMTFAVGPYFALNYGNTSAGVPVVSYGKSADTARCRTSFKKILRMVDLFERRFGSYPFTKVGYVVTNLGSMEHQSLICLARGEIQSLSDSVNKTIAHELAHQWFGDKVTPLDFRDAWLTESFATYSECLWNEELGGPSLYFKDLKSKITTYLTTVAKPGGRSYEGMLPIYDFPRAKPSSNYPQTIYLKGAGVLGMLRTLVGDSVFFSSLRAYQDAHAYGNATIDSMEKVFVDRVPVVLKDSIREYFAQWIRGRGWPVLDISAVQIMDGGEWKTRVDIRQVQADSMGVYTWFPLELTFSDAKGNATNRMLTVYGKEATFLLDSLPPLTGIGLNTGVRTPTIAVLTRTPVVTSVPLAYIPPDDVRAFPNPTNESVWLRVPNSGTWKFEIVNAAGRLVRELTREIADDLLLSLSLRDEPAGAYMIRATCVDSKVDDNNCSEGSHVVTVVRQQ